MKLGVNIDHIATLRQARKEGEPDVLQATLEALEGGADGITIHLREDRRHIQDEDVFLIRRHVPRLNLEMAATDEMVAIALKAKPDFCCLVPEKRNELTTEGGLDVIRHSDTLSSVIVSLQKARIRVSLFIDPNPIQIQAAARAKADYIEIHTGAYAHPHCQNPIEECKKIKDTAQLAHSLGLKVNAGHGLKYHNVTSIAKISFIEELNIGHSIVSRAMFIGLRSAVNEMKTLINRS